MICDTLATESLGRRSLGGDQHVAGRIDEAQIGCEDNRDDGAESTAVEGVTLYDKHRSTVPGLGTGGMVEFRPTRSRRARSPWLVGYGAALQATDASIDATLQCGVHDVESFCDLAGSVFGDKIRQRGSVEVTPRDTGDAWRASPPTRTGRWGWRPRLSYSSHTIVIPLGQDWPDAAMDDPHRGVPGVGVTAWLTGERREPGAADGRRGATSGAHWNAT